MQRQGGDFLNLLDETRVIISKKGKLLLENKTEPFVEVEVKGKVSLDLFSGESVNLHELELSDFKIVWRKKYTHHILELGEMTGKTDERWTRWRTYPSDRVFFQDRTRNKPDGGA